MRLSLQYEGKRSRIYALELDDGICPSVDFLEGLKRNSLPAHKSLVRRYSNHADQGPTHNPQHCLPVEGRENLFEWKTHQSGGKRLVFFNLPDGVVVMTHGFHKGAVARTEYDKAERHRDEYKRQIQSGKGGR